MMHSGQFIISPEPVIYTDYISHTMSNGWVLSHDKSVPVVNGGKNNDIWLIGHAWSIKADKKSPAETVSKFFSEDPFEILLEEPYWGGRFVLVIRDKIYTDATGLFSVFYALSEYKNGVSQTLQAVSSDIFFLKNGHKKEDGEYGKNYPNDVMRFIPGKYTLWQYIYRLAPSEVLKLSSVQDVKNITEPRLLLTSLDCKSENDILAEFMEFYCESLRNIASEFSGKQLLLPLTGGYDSRTVFALAKHSRIPFKCFTLEHDDMPTCDIEYPKMICEIMDTDYHYFLRDKNKKSKTREQHYFWHQNESQLEQDRTFYEYEQYQDLTNIYGPIVLLRGHLWEIPQEYAKKYINNTMNVEMACNSLCNHFELPYYSLPAISLHGGLSRIANDKTQHLPLSARYYWEMESACWHADNEHGFDIYPDVDSVQPLNSRYLLSLLMDLPEQIRVTKEFQVIITRKLCPQIGNIPYGKNTDVKRSLFDKVARPVKKLKRRLKNIGFLRTVSLYYHNIFGY